MIAQYEPECVYNMDETGLVFCLLPRYTTLMPSEDVNTTCGKKRFKDSVSLVVCAIVTGTHKIPCILIGKPKHQHIFKVKNGPCHILIWEMHKWMLKLAGNTSIMNFILKRRNEPISRFCYYWIMYQGILMHLKGMMSELWSYILFAHIWDSKLVHT